MKTRGKAVKARLKIKTNPTEWGKAGTVDARGRMPLMDSSTSRKGRRFLRLKQCLSSLKHRLLSRPAAVTDASAISGSHGQQHIKDRQALLVLKQCLIKTNPTECGTAGIAGKAARQGKAGSSCV